MVDVAFTSSSSNVEGSSLADYVSQSLSGRLDIGGIARYKYLLSVEGNDVATGLKWVSAVFNTTIGSALLPKADLLPCL